MLSAVAFRGRQNAFAVFTLRDTCGAPEESFLAHAEDSAGLQGSDNGRPVSLEASM